MLNGDAHHSLVWEAEPRILPLLNCQRHLHPKRRNTNSKQKNTIRGLLANKNGEKTFIFSPVGPSKTNSTNEQQIRRSRPPSQECRRSIRAQMASDPHSYLQTR